MQWQIASLVAIAVILLIVGFLLWHYGATKRKKQAAIKIKKEPSFGAVAASADDFGEDDTVFPVKKEVSITSTVKPTKPYKQEKIILQLRANPKRPYFGYELLQTLYANDFTFGDLDIFHRHEFANGKGPICFSLAAATKTGAFPINDMGAFYCAGLVMFMQLEKNKKLMTSLDLMLDTARQITEDLGGEILDLNSKLLDAAVIKEWRDKIYNHHTSRCENV